MTENDKLACLFGGMAGAMDQAHKGFWRCYNNGDDKGSAYYDGQICAYDVVFAEAQRLGLQNSDQGNVGDTLAQKHT